jgi:hypothetical protein
LLNLDSDKLRVNLAQIASKSKIAGSYTTQESTTTTTKTPPTTT